MTNDSIDTFQEATVKPAHCRISPNMWAEDTYSNIPPRGICQGRERKREPSTRDTRYAHLVATLARLAKVDEDMVRLMHAERAHGRDNEASNEAWLRQPRVRILLQRRAIRSVRKRGSAWASVAQTGSTHTNDQKHGRLQVAVDCAVHKGEHENVQRHGLGIADAERVNKRAEAATTSVRSTSPARQRPRTGKSSER